MLQHLGGHSGVRLHACGIEEMENIDNNREINGHTPG